MSYIEPIEKKCKFITGETYEAIEERLNALINAHNDREKEHAYILPTAEQLCVESQNYGFVHLGRDLKKISLAHVQRSIIECVCNWLENIEDSKTHLRTETVCKILRDQTQQILTEAKNETP